MWPRQKDCMHVKLDRYACLLASRRTATKMLTGRRRLAIYDQVRTAIMLTSKWSVSVQSCCWFVNQMRRVPLLRPVPEGSLGHLGIAPYVGIDCCPVLEQEMQPAIRRGDVRHLSIVGVPQAKDMVEVNAVSHTSSASPETFCSIAACCCISACSQCVSMACIGRITHLACFPISFAH